MLGQESQEVTNRPDRVSFRNAISYGILFEEIARSCDSCVRSSTRSIEDSGAEAVNGRLRGNRYGNDLGIRGAHAEVL